MPSAHGTTTETQEAHPQLLFIKKVTHLRPPRRKSESRPQNAAAYDRSARSMDVGPKALSKVDVRAHHHSLDQDRDSDESSPCHVSLQSPPSSPHRPDHSPPSSERPRPPESDGLPPSTPDSLPPAVPTAPDSLPPAVPTAPVSINGRAQTLPSRSVSIADIPGDGPEQPATMDAPTRRALAPRLATLPPPMMAGYNAEGRARLTPSLVTRQAPMPILNLPTLPPPTPSQPARPGRPSAPLRSIPALPMQGPSDAEQDADHESASLEDEEDDDESEEHAEVAQTEGHDADSGESGDEDDQDYFETSPRQPQATGIPHLGALPQVDTSRFSVSFADAESSRTHTQRTPHAPAGSSIDYFTSKSHEPVFSPMRTPRPADFQPNGKGRAQDVSTKHAPQPRIVPMPPTPGSPRPALYHLGSKSMVDLLSMSRKEKDKVISPKLGHALSPQKKSQAPASDGQAAHAEEDRPVSETESADDDVITSPMLRRRRSLPVYEPSSDPPPYPIPLFQRPRSEQQRLPIQPRDEEGQETLPAYSNAIYLAGVMPRKMEFTEPGVQAKDRKWRRVYCVLEGTMFRVYKAPPAGSAVSAIEQWWESKVGVGDITSVDVAAMTTSGIRVSAVRERERARVEPTSAAERPTKIIEEPAGASGQDSESSQGAPPQPAPTRSRLLLGSRLLHRQRSKSAGRLGSNSNNNSNSRLSSNHSSSRLSMDSRPEATGVRQSSSQIITQTRRSMDTLGSASRTSNVSSVGTASTGLTVPSPTSSGSFASTDSTSLFSRSRLLSHAHPGGRGEPPKERGREREREKEKERELEAPYTPDEKDLIRKYTLQHAESGLASDYTKRKNVIRVRMEGEQFLLQAKDVASVIDWIEGIQMGTNVALDLDERPMPRGPIFPRRRRRRVRRVEPAAAGS
ncbi:hypothetical protein BD413DRAFT_582495 [Trametes elegans]|nr:hypothetical protein BD413DRAFT_582495 [Trametes elegans]